ncbi:hypothetical protein [Haloferax volcanii]|uniref:Uncharacterized protein n=3 Tax=Haloferax volcanii TaxID=2246 RepID=A0A384L0N1_HALVD|nr:hypothetical protein [Haloferax volcanii]ADE01505.1 uncharacterized protein HVO_B0008 [Haloferax volcanii DS2]ELY36822.1 hypothetical protein C498_01710 [Haloferax volcanii DS2]MBS8118092.1 hypothetical protein [Haloferax volcanii]MBS8123104.1 hypothetical protein [Haloferax volcanii]MBS8126972.1 hypothetical protein [Haloferax volcanii]
MPDDESAKLAEKPHAGVVTCPACDLHVSVTEPNDAVDLYRRHANVTGHDVEWERVAFDVDVESDGVKTALTELGEDHPDGVELGRLAAALADNGVAIGETLDAVRDLRMSGEIYEPQDDYVLAV